MKKRPLIRIPTRLQGVLAVTVAAATVASIYLSWSRASIRSVALQSGKEWQTGRLDQIRASPAEGQRKEQWITGAALQEDQFRVLRWPVDSPSAPRGLSLPLSGKPSAWTLSRNGAWLHAVVHDRLLSYDLLHEGALHSLALISTQVPGITATSESEALVLYRNASYEILDARTGKETASGKLIAAADDVIRVENGSVLVEHRNAGKTEVYRFDSTGPSPSIEIEGKAHVSVAEGLSSENGLALDSGKGIKWQGMDLALPGPASKVLLWEDGWLFASGDYSSVYALAPAAEPIEFSFAFRPKTLLATHDLLLAGNGQSLFSFRIQQSSALRTNPGWLLVVCAAISMIGGFYVLSLYLELSSRMLLRLLDWVRPREIFSGAIEEAPVPSDLLDAFRRNRVVLWAGSGLLAQADYPPRFRMVRQLLDAAQRHKWSPESGLELAEREWKSGDTERAISELANSGPEVRQQIEEFTRRMYSRWKAVGTSTRNPVAQLPLAGAVTTNYGRVLEELNLEWDTHVCDLSSLNTRDFFFLKLYGDVAPGADILLSREELARELRENPQALAKLRAFIELRMLLFLGCSAEALLKDLDLLAMPRPQIPHYAVIAVSDSNWQQVARDLWRYHGVRVIPMAQDRIAELLPAWLGRLLEKLRSLPQEDLQVNPATLYPSSQ
jgi:hypothetical protein